jgi:hypothetical protein
MEAKLISTEAINVNYFNCIDEINNSSPKKIYILDVIDSNSILYEYALITIKNILLRIFNYLINITIILRNMVIFTLILTIFLILIAYILLSIKICLLPSKNLNEYLNLFLYSLVIYLSIKIIIKIKKNIYNI